VELEIPTGTVLAHDERWESGLCLETKRSCFGHKTNVLLLFNLVLQNAQVPNRWQTSIVIPIYKGKGQDKTDPSRYRSISLIPVVAKLIKKVVLHRITTYLKSNIVDFPNSQ